MLFFENVPHTSGVKVLLNGKEFPYKEIVLERKTVQPEVDNARNYEAKYIPTRTSSAITINGYYDQVLSSDIIDWLLDEERLEDEVRWFWTDNRKLKTGVYMIGDVRMQQTFETLLSYSAVLVPYKSRTRTHYGLLVRTTSGYGVETGEYAIGATVTINSEDANFSHWEIVELSNPDALATDETSTVSEYFASLDLTSDELTFVMQQSNLIIKPIMADVE